MEKFIKQYDKEFMKMAILKHEQTFREQVHELHRLYQIQKKLMKNISRNDGKAQNQETYLYYQNENNVHVEHPADKDEGGGVVDMEDEDEIELTLAPSSFKRRRSKSDTPLNSDSALSISSSSSGSSQIKRGERKRDNLTKNKYGNLDVSNPSFLSRRKNGSDLIEEQMRSQDRINQQPPWLYQVLSLNMT